MNRQRIVRFWEFHSDLSSNIVLKGQRTNRHSCRYGVSWQAPSESSRCPVSHCRCSFRDDGSADETLPKFADVLKRDAEAASNMLYREGKVGLLFGICTSRKVFQYPEEVTLALSFEL